MTLRYVGPRLWGTVIGNYTARNNDMTSAGGKLNFLRDYNRIGDPDCSLNSTQVALHNAGHLLAISLRLNGVSYTSVAAGQHDTKIRTLLVDMCNLDYTSAGKLRFSMFTLQHECDAKGAQSSGTPAGFIQAWRHVINLLRTIPGNSHVLAAWCTTGLYGATHTLSGAACTPGMNSRITAYYPGDAYVDIIANDPYDYTTNKSKWIYFPALQIPMVTWVKNTGYGRGKQQVLFEIGVPNNGVPSDQALWMQHLHDALANWVDDPVAPFIGMSYFDRVDTRSTGFDFQVATSSQKRTGWINAGLAWLGLPDIGGGGAPPPPTPPTAVYPFRSGAFYDPGSLGGIPANIRAFGTARGRDVDVAHDFPPKANWTQWEACTNGLDGTEFATGYRAMLSIPPIPNDGTSTLAQVAAGDHDAHIDTIATNIAAQFPGAQIIWRFWEPNVAGLWFAATGTSGGRPGSVADWNAAILRIMQRVYAIAPGVQFGIAVSRGYRTPISAFDCYPGDIAKSYGLRFWGFDGYDFHYGHPSDTPQQRWDNYVNDNANPSNREGAAQHAAFAAAHGLTLLVGEWASGETAWQDGGGGGDDPYFAQQFYAWCVNNLGPDGVEVIFQQDFSGGPYHKMATIGGDVPVDPKPLMWAQYQTLWAQTADALPTGQVIRPDPMVVAFRTEDAFLQAPPPGDAFAYPVLLRGGYAEATVDLAYATAEVDEPATSAVPSWPPTNTVWYEWTCPDPPPAAGDGTVTIDTLGSTALFGDPLNTILSVWQGSALASLTEVASNDDGPAGDGTSLITFTPTPGDTYLIRVEGNDASGVVNLTLSMYPVGTAIVEAEPVVVPFRLADAAFPGLPDPSDDGTGEGGGGPPPPAPPILAPPPNMLATLYRVSQRMPWPPPVDDYGVPQPDLWRPTLVANEPWGRVQVVVRGKDVTFFRGVPAIVGEISEAEPFGDMACEITFPQISWLERRRVGALWWLAAGDVTVYHVHPDETRGEPLFEGMLVGVHRLGGTNPVGISIQCVGALYQADYTLNVPEFVVETRDIFVAIKTIMDSTVSRNFAPTVGEMTGILTRQRGAWGNKLQAIQDILATAWTRDRENQWTLMKNPGRVPVVRLKDRDNVHWTVTAGSQGIDVDLVEDFITIPNVIYGEGTNPKGYHWRDSKYPGREQGYVPAYPLQPSQVFEPGGGVGGFQPFVDGMEARGYKMDSTDTYLASDRDDVLVVQRRLGIEDDGIVGPQTWVRVLAQRGVFDLKTAYIAPLAFWFAVEPYVYNADGSIAGPRPNFKPRQIRVERYINYGERITRREGAQDAWQQIAMPRTDTPNHVGTITFNADPEEGSRNNIHAGQNIKLQGIQRPFNERNVDDGLPDFLDEDDWLLLHIVGVRKTIGGTVTCDVSYLPHDLTTFLAIRERNKEASDPARRGSFVDRRRSKARQDAIAVFDPEAGAGLMPKIPLFGGLWTCLMVPFGEVGSIAKVVAHTRDSVSRFVLALFGVVEGQQPVTPNDLARLVGNPLASSTPFSTNRLALEDLGYLESWGSQGQACGYYPHMETDGATITGDFVDAGSEQYDTDYPPWVVVAVYAEQSCFFHGRFYPAPQEGV